MGLLSINNPFLEANKIDTYCTQRSTRRVGESNHGREPSYNYTNSQLLSRYCNFIRTLKDGYWDLGGTSPPTPTPRSNHSD